MDAWRPYTNAQNCDLWTFSNIFLQKPLFPAENRKVHSYKKLTNSAIQTLLNDLFTLDREKNEQTINEYVRQRHINMTWPQWIPLANHQSWFIQNWWLWTGSAFVEKNITKQQRHMKHLVLLWLSCHELRTDSNRNFSVTSDKSALSIRPRNFLINYKSLCHKCQCIVNC